MRIVTPEEAVAGIRSGDQVYVQCAAADPTVLLDALVARAAELRDVGMVHLHTEGPGPHLAPEMAPHFRHRALFIGPNARSGRSTRVAPTTSRSSSPTCRGCSRSGAVPARRRLRQRDAARQARLLLARTCRSRRCTRAIRAATTVIAQLNSGASAHARRELHPRRRHRPRRRGRRPAVRAPDRRRSATSSSGSASTSRSSYPTAPRSSSGSAPSRRRRPWRSASSATSASTPRCSPTAIVDLVEAGVDHRGPQGAQPGQDRHRRS